ncbi:hypothetical protein EJB05_26265, partial [Eragrostis curvula]
MAADRLSALPDDLLRRVLYFAPAKEGASTAVLSRRWRSLWRSSGAINLDWRSYHRAHGSGIVTFQELGIFFPAVKAALDAVDGRLTRLTFNVEADEMVFILLIVPGRSPIEHSMVDLALAHPSAQHLEELRVAAVNYRPDPSRELHYWFCLASLPSETLRDLQLINCTYLTPAPPGTIFPRLAALRLQGCKVSIECLQDTINAAPQLFTLHLESSKFTEERTVDGVQVRCHRLRFPVVIALVFADCSWSGEEEEAAMLELDLPRVRYFRYRGHVHNRLFLKPHEPSSVVRADLNFTGYQHGDVGNIRAHFWQFVTQNFHMVKVLKLILDFAIDRVAVVDKDGQDDILMNKLFYNVQHLELQGRYKPANKMAGFAIGNLLQCCPVVRDLNLKVTAIASAESSLQSSVGTQAQLDFEKSYNHFRQRKRQPISSGRDDDDKTYEDEISDVRGLSKRSFNCLQSCLRRVSLQFRMDVPNCFGVQLTKFFAENSQVLVELYVDDGSHKMCEHMNWMVRKWIANSSKRKTPPTATSIVDQCSRKRQRREDHCGDCSCVQ